jgi:4-hydroxythreonine-4-phosphate dehydrogenase
VNVIGITIGDPAGIGHEIIHKALASGFLPKDFQYKIFGSIQGHTPGILTSASALSAYQALEEAFHAWENKQIAAIVTAPIHKSNLASIGFLFPGHTEYFSHKCHIHPDHVTMVMHDPKLSVALLSIHTPLREAAQYYTEERILRTAISYTQFLSKIHTTPFKIALAGLNPHAGENGHIGNEEINIAIPTIKKLQSQGIPISGPFSPDTIYHRAAQGEFQGVIAAYHDQGLIPFKLLAFSTGVNVSLGLPLIRTSPDHGTAIDIAGQNIADPSSMIAAIQLACHLARTQLNITTQQP